MKKTDATSSLACYVLVKGGDVISSGMCPATHLPQDLPDGVELHTVAGYIPMGATRMVFEDGQVVDTGEPRTAPTYRQARRQAYPRATAQLDAIWKVLDALGADFSHPEVASLRERIQAVKAKFPKPVTPMD